MLYLYAYIQLYGVSFKYILIICLLLKQCHFRGYTIFRLDYNISAIFEQVEQFNQWSESLSGELE
jgi:hypothetical protein